MFLDRIPVLALSCLALISSVSCSSKTPDPSADAGIFDDAGTDSVSDGGSVVPAIAISGKAKIRPKRVDQLQADLAAALAIPAAQLCREVGAYSCFDVHGIALGGVEPYVLNIYEPLGSTTITSPIVTERILLSGCRERVDRDLAGTPEIFASIPLDAAGNIRDLASPAIDQALDSLYRHFLLRNATAGEREHLRGLYADVEAEGGDRRARSWAILACFAVGTTAEFLFY